MVYTGLNTPEAIDKAVREGKIGTVQGEAMKAALEKSPGDYTTRSSPSTPQPPLGPLGSDWVPPPKEAIINPDASPIENQGRMIGTLGKNAMEANKSQLPGILNLLDPKVQEYVYRVTGQKPPSSLQPPKAEDVPKGPTEAKAVLPLQQGAWSDLASNDPEARSAQSAGQRPSGSGSGGPGGGGGAGGGNPMIDANKEFERKTMKNLDEQEANLQKQGEFESDYASFEAEQIKRNNEELAARNAEIQEQHQKRVFQANVAWNQLNEASKSLANYQEDPDRYWNSRTGGQKALAIIGGILGAAGGRSTGGRNLGLDALNQHIDRDVAAQRAAYSAKKDSVAAQSSAFGQMMSMFHDEDSSSLALRTLLVDETTRKMQTLAASSKSQIVGMNMQKALTALGQQRNQLEYQFKMQQYDMAAKAAAAQAAAQAGADTGANGPIVDTDTFVPMGDTPGGQKLGLSFSSKEEANEFRKSQEATITSRKAIADLEHWNTLSATEKATNFNERAKMNQAREMLGQAYGHAISGAQTSDKERERLQSRIDDAVSNVVRVPGYQGAEEAMTILKRQLTAAEEQRKARGRLAVETSRVVSDPKNKGKKIQEQAVVVLHAPRPQETTSADLPPMGKAK